MMRARLVAFLVAVLGVLAGCTASEPGPPPAEREMRRARAFAEELVQAGRSAETAPEVAVSLGYLERLRLGMGSPFRLAEYALHDPRLADSIRVPLAWAILARTLDGEAYRLDPEALDPVSWGGVELFARSGAEHLELISEAVEESRSARGGELAVRLAYTLAAAEGSAGRTAAPIATGAAVLLRDRRLAREDARDLLRAAEEAGVSPLDLLSVWRRERRFRVEAPAFLPLDPAVDREMVEAAHRLLARLRTSHHPALSASPPRPVLRAGAAERLAAEAERLDYPAQAPVAATLLSYRTHLFPDGPPADSADPVWRFLRAPGSEERFAAEYARLRATADEGPGPSLVALFVAVALRTHAQEKVWYPGFPAPTEHELRSRHQLASLSFDPSVPEAWRPYYLHVLGESLRDLARVFPSMTLKGLHVRFGEHGRAGALAVHVPRSRTIVFPPETGAGTVAHEIAHDFDWQAAHLRYGTRYAYRTDRAVSQRGDRLAAAVQELAAGPLAAPVPGTRTGTSLHRPTEVFAHSVDWFVAASLAREGRSNGYLSAVQDRELSGFGSAAYVPRDGRAAGAIVRILDEVAPASAESRSWFLERYGAGRPPPLLRVARDVVGAAPSRYAGPPAREPRSPFLGLHSPAPVPALAVPEEEAEGCGPAGWESVLGEDPLRREVAAMAVRSAAWGRVLRQAERVAGAAGRDWVARRLHGTPPASTPLDFARAQSLEPLLRRVEGLEREAGGFVVPRPGISSASRPREPLSRCRGQ